MKNIVTFFVTLFLATSSFSQSKKKDTTSTTETSSKIRVFTPSSSFKSKADNSYRWAVKTDLFAILTGEYPIIGEYRIGSKFSVEASAALTYGEIFSALSDDDDYLTAEDAEMGSAFRVAFKYFPSTDYDAIEGWFIGVQLMNKTTNKAYDDSYSYNFNEKETKVKTGVSLILGKQVFQDSNVIWEFYGGVGIASTKHSYYDVEYDENDEQQFQRFEKSKSKPNILFGLRIGFGN